MSGVGESVEENGGSGGGGEGEEEDEEEVEGGVRERKRCLVDGPTMSQPSSGATPDDMAGMKGFPPSLFLILDGRSSPSWASRPARAASSESARSLRRNFDRTRNELSVNCSAR